MMATLKIPWYFQHREGKSAARRARSAGRASTCRAKARASRRTPRSRTRRSTRRRSAGERCAPSYDFLIPADTALLGVHLRTQALILATPRQTTQILDALIGE
jgi:hypothetical protein